MNIDLMPYYAQPGPLPFPKRWATMPWRDSRPLPAESLQDSWQSLLQKRFLAISVYFTYTFHSVLPTVLSVVSTKTRCNPVAPNAIPITSCES